jgi:hypothetical protein
MSKLLLSSAVVATSLALMTPAAARAETFDKLTYLTFTGTVQVPGATLSAGTYQFHLTNPDTSRNVMQVLSYNGKTVFAMFNTIPDVRTAVTLDPTVTFREVPADVPPPIHSVFYGGESIGYEFLYPKGGPDLTPATVAQPPVRYTPVIPPQAITLRREPVEAPVAAAPVAELAPEPVAAIEPVTLPKTATRLPMIGIGGLGLLAAGVALALARRNS